MAHLDLQRGTFAAADTLLGKRDSRKVGHNTELHRSGSDAIAVRYHATDVYTMTREGWAIIRTGGWHTTTTSARVNALLPGPWRVYFTHGLYRSGYPIVPFADGLAVNTETGAVGIAARWGTAVDTLLTSDEVDAAVTAGEERARVREERRAARLLREHPESRHVFDPVPAPADHFARIAQGGGTSFGEVYVCRRCGETALQNVATHYRTPDSHSTYGKVIRLPDIPDAALAQWGPAGPHRQGYNGHGRDCARCHVEEAEARGLRREALGRLHDAGAHREDVVKTEWPVDPVTGRTDYSGPMTRTVTGTRDNCPWECPRRKGY